MANITIRGPGATRLPREVLEAVARCCCPEGGSGSGSGGAQATPCCENGWAPGTASWTIADITCDNADCITATATAADSPGCEFITDAMPDGWQLRGGVMRVTKSCPAGAHGISNDVTIELCCIENIADPTQTQLWLFFNISFKYKNPPVDLDGWLVTLSVTTHAFNVADCEAGILEIIDRPMDIAVLFGVPTCSLGGGRLTLVLT